MSEFDLARPRSCPLPVFDRSHSPVTRQKPKAKKWSSSLHFLHTSQRISILQLLAVFLYGTTFFLYTRTRFSECFAGLAAKVCTVRSRLQSAQPEICTGPSHSVWLRSGPVSMFYRTYFCPWIPQSLGRDSSVYRSKRSEVRKFYSEFYWNSIPN